jgi:porin
MLITSLLAAQSSTPSTGPLSKLQQRGVSLSLDFYNDVFAAPDTSTRYSAGAQQFADLSAAVHLGRFSKHLSRTDAFVSLHVNGTANADLGGALQAFSSVQSPAGIRLAEVWLEQAVTPWAHVRVGRIDGNRDFALVENSLSFVNSSASYTPTFVALPNYNSTRTGLEVLLRNQRWHFHTAAFSPLEGTGALLVTEAGLSWSPRGWNGRATVGGWGITGKNSSLSGDRRNGAHGMYIIGEQKFWRREREKGNEQSLAAFFDWGAAPSLFSSFSRHMEIGTTWTAPLARRDKDALGFSVARGKFSPLIATNHESVWEAFYRVQLTPALSLSPDLQYFTNAAGASPQRNFVAIGTRMAFSLSMKSE